VNFFTIVSGQVAVIGQFSQNDEDFGFVLYYADSGVYNAEVHFAHPSLVNGKSFPILCSVTTKSLLWTTAQDGFRAWNIEKINGNETACHSSFVHYESGMDSITHTVFCSNNLVCCAFKGYTGLVWFDPFGGRWEKNYIKIDHGMSSSQFKVSCIEYWPEENRIWLTLSDFDQIVYVDLSLGKVNLYPMSVGMQHTTHLLFIPNSNVLCVVVKSQILHFVKWAKIGGPISSVVDQKLPTDSLLTSLTLINRSTAMSGHANGLVIEWDFVGSMPQFQVLPLKHIGAVMSIITIWDSAIWTADLRGVICVWR
jgi:hypothetical protein